MEQETHTYLLPAIIVIIGAVAAGAIFFVNGSSLADAASPQRARDNHVYGDKNAPVTIVEFSDLECPFCSRLHPILKRIVDESGGSVKWEYRHLPLSIHPNAKSAAIAAECVAELAGNQSFFEYIDRLFENQRSLGAPLYLREAEALGIQSTDFNECIVSDEMAMRIEEDIEAATALGGNGTPFSVIVDKNGDIETVSGALPYERWRILLENKETYANN